MSETAAYPVLEYIVKLLKDAIADAPVIRESASVYVVKDGNDEIRLVQDTTSTGEHATILITDTKRILTSEDLLETLQYLADDVKDSDPLKTRLQNALVIVNDLNIETELIFQGIRSFLDEVSNSYEFYKMVSGKVTVIESVFKFGDNLFGLVINNEPTQVTIKATFPSSFDAGIKKTIATDAAKVESAVNKMFKGA